MAAEPYVNTADPRTALRAAVRQFRSPDQTIACAGSVPEFAQNRFDAHGSGFLRSKTVAAIDDPKNLSKAQPLQNPRLAPRACW